MKKFSWGKISGPVKVVDGQGFQLDVLPDEEGGGDHDQLLGLGDTSGDSSDEEEAQARRARSRSRKRICEDSDEGEVGGRGDRELQIR